MRKTLPFVIFFGCLISAVLLHAEAALAPEPDTKDYYVYASKSRQAVNHFAPSGWIGDSSDLKFQEVSDPLNAAETCLKITYTPKGSNGWASIYWQNPPNNWGTISGGVNLSKFKKLTFRARGAVGEEKVDNFKIGGIEGIYGDTDSASSGTIQLTPIWTSYTIDLSGKDLTRIIGGFCLSVNRDENLNGATFYLTDIRFER